jgi:hypothetical protein
MRQGPGPEQTGLWSGVEWVMIDGDAERPNNWEWAADYDRWPAPPLSLLVYRRESFTNHDSLGILYEDKILFPSLCAFEHLWRY